MKDKMQYQRHRDCGRNPHSVQMAVRSTPFALRSARYFFAMIMTASLCLCACADTNDENPNFQQIGQSIDENTVLPEGIYAVSGSAENAESCDTPGTSVISESPYMVAVGIERVGWWTLRLAYCETPEDCRAQRDDMLQDAGAYSENAYDLGEVSEDGFSEEIYLTAVETDENEQCVGGVRLEQLLAVADESLQLTVLEAPVPPYEPTDTGSCFSENIGQAGMNAPCALRKDIWLERIE